MIALFHTNNLDCPNENQPPTHCRDFPPTPLTGVCTLYGELGAFAEPVAEQCDVLLQLGRLLEYAERRRVHGLVLGAFSEARSEEVRDGSVDRLLPTLQQCSTLLSAQRNN